MKKLLSVVLAASMVCSMTACSSNSGDTAKTVESAAEAVGEVAAEVESAAQSAESAEAQSAEAQSTEAAANSDAKFYIGGSGPLTGGAAQYGLAVERAGQIAVDEINANGGINGYQVVWLFEDDEHDAEKALNAYNTLKDQGLQIMVGTVTSGPCLSVVQATKDDNMFQITPSGSTQDITINDNVYRMCFSDPAQGEKSAQYISEHKLATKVGVIYDSSDSYSQGIYETFDKAAEGYGLEVVAAEAFTADSKTDFTTQLQKMKDAGAELLFMPFYYTEAALVLKQAKEMNYAPKFFGVDGMDGILTLEGFDTSLAEGVILLTPFSADATDDLTVNFVNSYKEKWNEIPNQFAADAYDCLYVIKAAAEAANVTPDMSVSDICEALKEGMKSVSINGVTGEDIHFSENGEPNKAPKAVVIENGAYKLAD